MKQICLFVIAGILFSCQQPVKKVRKQAEPDPKLLISCEGIGEVKLSDTNESLRQKFGDQAVSVHENTESGFFTTVWENDPKQINIYWREKKAPFKTIKYIEAVGTNAPYMTRDSVRIGNSLRDLVKINGNISVTFKNILLNADPGRIISFNGGNIEKNQACLGGVLEQVSINNVHKDELAKLQSQEELHSFDPIMNRIDLELVSIRLSKQ